MMVRGTVAAVLAAVTIVGGVAAGAVLHHNESQATAQTPHAERTQRVAAMHAMRRPARPRLAARVAAAASYRVVTLLPTPGMRAGRLAQLRSRALRSDEFAIAAPHAPLELAQVGGREPA